MPTDDNLVFHYTPSVSYPRTITGDTTTATQIYNTETGLVYSTEADYDTAFRNWVANEVSLNSDNIRAFAETRYVRKEEIKELVTQVVRELLESEGYIIGKAPESIDPTEVE